MPQIKWAFRAPGQSDEKRHLKTSCKFLNSQGEKGGKKRPKKVSFRANKEAKGQKVRILIYSRGSWKSSYQLLRENGAVQESCAL